MRTIALLLVASAAGATPMNAEKIAAVVNSEIILLSEVKERVAQLGQPTNAKNAAEQRQLDQALRAAADRMVEDLLTVQQAAELKLTVEEAEIDRAIDEVKKQNQLDDATFTEALQAQGFTLAGYRKDLRKQILRLKVINTAVRSRVNVSDEEVKAFYDQNARHAGGERRLHVRHVFLAVASDADAKEVEKRRAFAQRVVDEAKKGKDFAELAKAHSDDAATRGDGGDLGWVKADDGLPEVMAQAIFAMTELNEVRGPIRTERGFEVFQLVDKKDGDVRPFAEVKDQIRQQLYATQVEKATHAWLAELRKKAHVEMRL